MAVKAAAAPVRQRVAIRRDNFVAGGICPEGDYEVLSSEIVTFAYASKDNKPTGAITTAHHLSLQPLNADGAHDGTPIDQNYSIGDTKLYAPSADGNFIEMVGTKTTLSESSNFFIEYTALCAAGVPEALLEEQGVGILTGMRGHIAHIPAPDRSAMQRLSPTATGVAQPDKKDLPKTIPVFKSISSAPWDKGKKPPARPAAQAAQAAANLPATGDGADAGADNRLANFVKEVVNRYSGKIGLTQAKLQVMKLYNKAGVDQATREAEMAVFDDEAGLENTLASVSCTVEDNSIELVK